MDQLVNPLLGEDERLLRLVERSIAELRLRHPHHAVRIILSTVPPDYPETDERPAVPVILEAPAAFEGRH